MSIQERILSRPLWHDAEERYRELVATRDERPGDPLEIEWSVDTEAGAWVLVSIAVFVVAIAMAFIGGLGA